MASSSHQAGLRNICGSGSPAGGALASIKHFCYTRLFGSKSAIKLLLLYEIVLAIIRLGAKQINDFKKL
jgi:hypothetical protein